MVSVIIEAPILFGSWIPLCCRTPRMHPSDAVFSHVALGARGAIATGAHAGLMPRQEAYSRLLRQIRCIISPN